ncbi:helix-turn-helix domain-containing protein [Actinomadura kijaniata]|uniref:helix-turn-helix domain-containing protein n=1 Tax=Actinomadura kijaniata TaxID=46161 RepID=UPI000835D85F|nr:helix-turn-helix domain-containing protein [Actinomadura kijaniata]
MTASQPLTRTHLVIDDPDQARACFERLYDSRLLVGRSRGAPLGLDLTVCDAGRFTSADLTLPGELTHQATRSDYLIIAMSLAGVVQYDHGKDTDRFSVGQAHIGGRPDLGCWARSRGLHARTVTLPLPLLTRAAGDDHFPGPLRFTDRRPLTAAAHAHWKATVDYVDGVLDGLLDDPGGPAPLLILGSTAQLLAATALAVFPNTWTHRDDPSADRAARVDATPTTLARAVAHIDAHYADPDLSIADIAAAACATPRAVQYAFRRHRGTTPMAYLRQVRMAAAHADLAAADPTTGITVTAVATRWGFAHPGRFAAAYRAAYGVPPSHTLHT